MMISPKTFIEQYKDKKYAELLPVRDRLIREIRRFEKQTYDKSLDAMCPSPEVQYQCKLMYLGELCKLIYEKYNEEYVWGGCKPYNKKQK